MKFFPTIVTPRAWAEAGNYPAGPSPWNGFPMAVDPVANWLTPGDHPAMEHYNFLFQDSKRRLLEAKKDLTLLTQLLESMSLSTLSTTAAELRGFTCTASGRPFISQNAGGTYDFARLAGSGILYGFASVPTMGGNNDPTFNTANGELVLFGDSPESYIYDADAKTFSAAITSGTSIMLDAVPSGTGWLSVWVDSLSFAAAAANKSGPRSYSANSLRNFAIRTVSSTGTVGADTASVALLGCMASLFTTGDIIRINLVKCAGDTDYFFLVSGETGSKMFGAGSVDSGATWTTSTLPDPYAGSDCSWTVEYDPPTAMLVLAVSKSTETRIYTSPDMGANWTQLGATYLAGADAAKGIFSIYDMRRMAGGALIGLGHSRTASNANDYYPLHASFDGGATWHLVGQLLRTLAVGSPTLAGWNAPMILTGGGGQPTYHSKCPAYAMGA